MKLFTTDRLIQQVTEKGSLATGDFGPQEILNLAHDCLLGEITPFLISLRQDYGVKQVDVAIVKGQASYPIPSRSAGMTLHDIKLLKNESVCTIYQMSRQDVTTTAEGEPQAFYKQENSIILYPTPQATQHTLRMTYFMRPPALVPVSECGKIESIDFVTNTITGSFPVTWSVADLFDLVNAKSGFEYKAIDVEALGVTSNSITLSSLPANLAVGDYISLQEESCFPQIPVEAHQLLVHMTLAACLESKGDRDGFTIAQGKIGQLQNAMKILMQDRIEGRPQRMRSRLI